MIEIALKLIMIAILILIYVQDRADRLVNWFLYPMVALVGYILYARQSGFVAALMNAGVSLFLVLLVLGICYLYAVAVMKKGFLNESMGTGDILFFVCLPFTFATVSFTVLFVFSLLFSLLLHYFLSKNQLDKTVPLAGYMSLFFAGVYLFSFFIEPKYLFSF